MTLTCDFQLTLDRRNDAARGSLRVQVQEGVSQGSSTDGSLSVTILGLIGQSGVASALADGYVNGGRRPDALKWYRSPCVVTDTTTASANVIMPPIGPRLLYWCAKGDTLAVASRPDRVLAALGHPPRIQLDALYRYVYFHVLPGPAAIYDGASKLEGGHYLHWCADGVRVARYWLPRFDDDSRMDENEATAELRNKLRDAVARSLGSGELSGAFLSGGLDSSTVAGLAAAQVPGIPTVSMGFDAQGYDETEFARIASRHFGTTSLEYYVTPDDVLATLPTIAAAFPEPFGNSSAAAAYHCARIARDHGLTLLLAGDGGDELFGGNERYSKQLVFERYGSVPKVLRSAVIEPLVGAVGRATRAFPIGKALSYIEQAIVPLPDRLEAYNFLHRHDPSEMFTAELLASVDRGAPLRMMREEYATPVTSSAVNRMLFLDWKFTLHDNDLVKVNTMCQLAGVDVAYPMLDQNLVDFSLRIPGNWKVHKGQLRWFYKRAMQGFLPDEIINKPKHGFGLPFGVWTRTHEGLRRLSEDALATLSERNFFRPEFLRHALRLHREGHASYYGELVWLLTVLELWLRAHAPDAACD